ncbi:Hsp70 family protein [Nocardia sp. NPDC088792]|uniref:Hsp70 family protein n=1 Tax=Nocardia sp. NPDC088792 TaxID=3364332 RepID=UPI003830B160
MTGALGIVIGSDAFVHASNDERRSTRIPAVIRFDSGSRASLGRPAGTFNYSDSDCEYRDFTTRVGDPVPVVADNGTPRTGVQLVATSIDLMLGGTAGVVAHPVVWTGQAVLELREVLSQHETRAQLVNEAEAAYAALRAGDEIAADSTILLCNAGKSGMDLTVVTATSTSVRVDQPVHCHEFGGDLVDALLVEHVLDELSVTHPGFDAADRRNWTGLRELRTRIAQAKRQLSSNVSAVIEVNLPGAQENLRLVRSELEALIAEPVWQAVQRITQSADAAIRAGHTIDAIVLIGGSSAIPLLTENLSAATDIPLVNATDPGHTVVRGAALLAARMFGARPRSDDRPWPDDRPRPRSDAAARVLRPGESAPAARPTTVSRPKPLAPQPQSAAPQPKPATSQPKSAVPQPKPAAPRPASAAHRPSSAPAQPTPAPAMDTDRARPGRRKPVVWGVAAAAAVLAILGGAVVGFAHTDSTGPRPVATSQQVPAQQAPAQNQQAPSHSGGHH